MKSVVFAVILGLGLIAGAYTPDASACNFWGGPDGCFPERD